MKKEGIQLKEEAYQAAEKGDLHTAVELYEKASLLCSEDADIFYYLGVAYGELALRDISREELWEDKTDEEDYFENAVKNLLKAAEMAPKNYHAWNNLGLLYKALDWDDKAAEAFERSLKIEPGQEDIMEMLNDLK